MKIEVLLSTMHQKDWSIIEKCNIRSNAIIINQCNENKTEEINFNHRKIKMISTTERGLSKSRNMALKNSRADICILCDDDIVYKDNYDSMVLDAFTRVPDADVIIFNVISKNIEKRKQEKLFTTIKRIPSYKSYSSVHIAFKRMSIVNNNIYFNENFGSGSGLYSFAEDSIFFSDIHKNNLRSYTYPAIIADLYTGESTWFKGFNKKYFYDTGAFLAAAYPELKNFYKWYYPLRLFGRSSLTFFEMVKYINQGIEGYKELKPYSGN